MSMSNVLRNKLVDFLLRAQAYSPPATLYVALCTSPPTAAAVGTEVTATGYTRAAVTSSLANWAGTQSTGSTTASTGTSGLSTNNATITFGTPTVDVSGNVSHYMVMDASTAGNMLFFGTIVDSGGTATPRTVAAGDGLSFAAGTLKVQLT